MVVCKNSTCNGRPIIFGTRIEVQSILWRLLHGDSKEDILADYNWISEKDFEDCLSFSIYAVSKFNNNKDLNWSQDTPYNIFDIS